MPGWSLTLNTDTSFSGLGLADPLLRALADVGYTSPTPIQAKAIPVVLTGRDLLAAARGVSCAAGFAPGRSTAEPQDGPARATGAAGGASRRAGALDACLDSLVRHGWAHKDAAGAYRLTDEGAFHKDEAYRALGACLAGI